MYTSVLALPALITSAVAQTTVISALLGKGFVASVVSANPCGTTLQATCADDSFCSEIIYGNLTYTQGPSSFQVTYSGFTLGGSGIVTSSCNLSGIPATKAVCSVAATRTASRDFETLITTITRTTLPYGPLTITAGIDQLGAATGSCSGSRNAAPAPTALVHEVYKVIVPVGAAALLALA